MNTISPRFEWSLSFLAVIEKGSFTRAAEQLGCTKGHISKQIIQLEDSLGVKLLHRTTRRLELTDAGNVYLDYCRRLRETLEEAERAVSHAKDIVSGQIRMSVPTSYGIEFMSDFLVKLHERYPELEIDLDLSIEQRDLLSGRYDLALRFAPSIEDHLIAKPMGSTEDWVVASRTFSKRIGRISDPKQLQGLPCLYNSHFSNEHLWDLSRDKITERIEAVHWLKVNNYPMIRRAALADLGIARLPSFLVLDDVRSGSLVRLLPSWSFPSRPVFLVFPDLRPLPGKLRAVVDFFHQWYLSRWP